MDKVYCISSGCYSDWRIDYVFLSEEKRNQVLEKLIQMNDDYGKCDYDLSDNKFDISNCKNFIGVICDFSIDEFDNENFDFQIKQCNTIESNKEYFVDNNYYEWLDKSVEIDIQRIEHEEKSYEELYSKYLKICRDYYAKSKYLKEVDGLDWNKINEILFIN